MRLTNPCGLLAAIIAFSSPPVHAAGPTPEESLRKMKVADGFEVKLVASEPLVRNAVTMSFDDRGRIWIIQYLQYPTPSGLKPVKVDQFLRTQYDKMPDPPPKGPKGNDRITILEDPDEQGRFRKSKDFVTGLNLASGMALGHGGVFVVQPPYLLFYPDKNGDDIPDGDPEVLLTGFGMEDAHAFANSLQWGPDGWLYGAQGSTVTAKIRGIEFQQGIWRYHPVTKEFELFSEGGGNTWGLDFDRRGQIIAGTNYGSSACLHQVQGAYYVKNFGKHGALHNPYSFGYFEHIPYTGFKGGHVTCGGVLCTGGIFPKEIENQYVAGNLLSFAVNWHQLERQGSSFTAKHGGELLSCADGWFRPIDCLVGPDGAIYVVDWSDTRANHVDPVDNWDREKGRIWKIAPKGANAPIAPKTSLSKLSSKELVGLLAHPNQWYCGEARRILAERRDPAVVPILKQILAEKTDRMALEALWALYVSGGFDDALALKLCDHANEDVRAWTVRLLGDAKKVSAAVRDRLIAVARSDPSPVVRNQLACTAKRLPTSDCLPIVRELLRRSEDVGDPQIPLLVWWAIESKAGINRQEIQQLLSASEAWRLPIVEMFIVERLARRWMAAGGEDDLQACVWLVDHAPTAPDLDRVIAGLEKGLEGKNLAKVPQALEKPLAELTSKKPGDPTVLRLALRLGSSQAFQAAHDRIADAKAPVGERIGLMEILSQLGKAECVPLFLQLFKDSADQKVRTAALSALQPFSDVRISAAVLSLYPQLSADLKSRARTLLFSRPPSSLDFLQLVEAGKVDPKEVPVDQLRPVVAFNEEPLTKLVEKHWGKIAPQTDGEKRSRIVSIGGILRNGPGDPGAGKALFTKHCAVCHTLFGEGNKVGPDLTSADRKNREFLITSTVDPSAVVRPEFVAYVAATKDGRVLTGLIVESSAEMVTLVDAKNEKTTLMRANIDELEPSRQSLMPEKLLDPFTDQELRDLFAYLQTEQPKGTAVVPPKDKDSKLKVLLISGSLEYKSDESLAAFQEYLEKNYPIQCLRAFRKADDDIPGLEQLDQCDLAIFFTRRLTIDGPQLERIKKYCDAGKPIIGLRTASHGFQKWLDMDKLIFGGSYGNHYKDGPVCEVKIADKLKDHPVLAGVKEFKSVGSLYKNPDNAKDVQVLLTGSIPGNTEPIAWVRDYKGGRVFYTSLGHPDDFKDDNFKRLLVNAIFWTTKREAPKK